ncbi:PD-(D/E)XK nuclease family protein [Clostridium sp. JN-9]|uniref:PD-(D/E)XK nuclease family protein n=1 Tax=Clostridium sp. JN-9 TaxID=2507159 RepID=UPI001FA96071|nr:PD-(D/E)XK nuclease family protein [Clostridium sp. JN-9]
MSKEWRRITVADMEQVHDFAVKWCNKFQDQKINYIELIDHYMADDCDALGFNMDCGNAFSERYGKAINDYEELDKVIDDVNDIELLGSAIYSKWRYFNHWAYMGEEILEFKNRSWVILALSRLAMLTGKNPFIFEGTPKKISIVSNNISYGPCPEPSDEVGQHITINAEGRVWFSAYTFGGGFGQYEKDRTKNYKIGKEAAGKVLNAVAAYFSQEYDEIFATDIGDWQMELTNTDDETYKFKGSLCADFEVDGTDLSDLIRDSLEMDDLYVFDGNCKSDRVNRITVNPTHKSREIIINKMYVGAFLSEGDNIGHEIINLYKADDGKNYIYLNSQGTIELSHGENKITVLLVRKCASKTYKVLAKAGGITILDFADSRLPREERYKGQVSLGLTYGGISLVDLFNENSYHGSLQEEKNVYTTFAAGKVIKPKNQIYITDEASVSDDNTFFIRTNKGFGKQTLREFYNENEKPDSFADLNQIIENDELWEDTNTTQAISELPKLQKDPYFNFLKIIRQEDNELAFSNMFAYFFNINRKAFSRFAGDVLHMVIQTDFTIEREKKNIDLLISDKNNVVVIENKIKSSINGIDDRHDIYSDKVQSQLKKYYQFVTTDDEYCRKTASCFIFLPNYNRIDLSKFSCGEKYTIVYYREIYNFFVENRNLFNEVPYIDDFINAMYKHTKDYDNDLEEEMQRRFQNTIRNAKKR